MWIEAGRCCFRENGPCDQEPIYLVHLADCTACAEHGYPRCISHRACMTHGAEARSDEYLFTSDDSDVKVTRIRTLTEAL